MLVQFSAEQDDALQRAAGYDQQKHDGPAYSRFLDAKKLAASAAIDVLMKIDTQPAVSTSTYHKQFLPEGWIRVGMFIGRDAVQMNKFRNSMLYATDLGVNLALEWLALFAV